MFRINNISEQDKHTWELFQSGKTVGCFQLEKPYTGEWCRKVVPDKIQDLSDILSIIRPGCTQSIEDGKSMTQHYVDRKNGTEPLDYKIPELEPILNDTYGVLTYQEQAMKIAIVLAGFTEQQADTLRKAIGHKDTQIMSRVEGEFLDGIRKTGIISEESGKEIFENIRASQRYSFNKSHGVAYAKNSYRTAFCKTHYPIEFFCVYLQYARFRDEFEEVRTLVNDAKDFGIAVKGPTLLDMQENFYIKNEDIYFGLTNIRDVGQSFVVKLKNIIGDNDISELNFDELAVKYLSKLPITGVRAMINAGAFDYLILRDKKYSRAAIEYYMSLLRLLRDGEMEWLATFGDFTQDMVYNLHSLARTKKEGGGCSQANRVAAVKSMIGVWEKPPLKLVDNLESIASTEEKLLGISLTCHITETYDEFMVTDFCKDVKDSGKSNFNLCVSIVRVAEKQVQRGSSAGQMMAFISAEDRTGIIDNLVIFSDAYAAYKDTLTIGNVVGVGGFRSKNNSLVVEKVWSL